MSIILNPEKPLVRTGYSDFPAVPSGWEISKVKYVGDYINGLAFKPEDWEEEGIPIIRIQNLTKAEARANCTTKIFHPKYKVKSGDILISWSASLSVHVWLQDEAWLNQHIFKAIPRTNKVLKDYFFWLANWFIKEMAKETHGSTLQHITWPKFGNFKVPLPPKNVQMKISEYLNVKIQLMDKLIASQEKLIQLIREKKDQSLDEVITRGTNTKVKLKKTDVPWIDEIPNHWDVFRGKFLFKEMKRPVRTSDDIITCYRDGQVALRSKRRADGYTLAVIEHGYQGIRKGDLVIHSMDAFAGAVGISEDDGKCTPEYVVLTSKKEYVHSEYFSFLLRVMAKRNFIFVLCPSVRERAPRYRYAKFAETSLVCPPFDEQKMIVKRVYELRAQFDALESKAIRQIELLEEKKVALISDVILGNINLSK